MSYEKQGMKEAEMEEYLKKKKIKSAFRKLKEDSAKEKTAFVDLVY